MCVIPGLCRDRIRDRRKSLPPPGLEPGTYGLEIRCSIHLSYGGLANLQSLSAGLHFSALHQEEQAWRSGDTRLDGILELSHLAWPLDASLAFPSLRVIMASESFPPLPLPGLFDFP